MPPYSQTSNNNTVKKMASRERENNTAINFT
jgi:hypothetical protein